MRERIAKLGEEISGLTEQRDANRLQITLIGRELEGIRKVWKNRLVSLERITALKRDAARGRAWPAQRLDRPEGRGSEIEL